MTRRGFTRSSDRPHSPLSDHDPSPGTEPVRAVTALVDAYGGRLRSLAMRLCGHRADAEDLVQDVFLQAFAKWHMFRGESSAATWLFAIAARACKTRTRRKGGVDRRMPAMSQLAPWGEQTVMAIAAAPSRSSNTPERKEAIERVQAEIARLPEHLRMPLVLKEVLELSVAESAGALGLTENTIKTRLHRGRLALRKAMTRAGRRVAAPQPIFDRQVCLDLLKAKMAAMDRGGAAAGFTVPQAEMCARCRGVFRELDLVQEACAEMGSGPLPPALRAKILRTIAERDHAEAASVPPRRGRRPLP